MSAFGAPRLAGSFVVLCAVLVSALGVWGCSEIRDEPEPVGGEEVVVREGPEFPDTPAGRALSSHFQTIYATGPEAEASYQASLSELRTHEAEAVAVLLEAYDSTDKALYSGRWTFIQTLSDLRLEAALEPLVRIANEPVPPPEEIAMDDIVNPFEEEVILRMTAIQGLGHLAVRDDRAAEALGELTRHDVLAVREEAMRALAGAIRAVKDRERIAYLKRFLPEDFELILDLSQDRPVPPAGANPGLAPATAQPSAPPPSVD